MQILVRLSNESDLASAHQCLLLRGECASNSDEGMILVFPLHAGTPKRSSVPIHKRLGGLKSGDAGGQTLNNYDRSFVQGSYDRNIFSLYGRNGLFSFMSPIHMKLHIQ